MQRDPRLHRLSGDHHHALVLARRARAAAAGDPREAERLWDDVVARFRAELEPHFQVEEALLLPALAAAGEDALVERTRDDHAALRAAADDRATDVPTRLRAFAARLEAHVRFEERELLEAAQERLDAATLDAVARATQRA